MKKEASKTTGSWLWRKPALPTPEERKRRLKLGLIILFLSLMILAGGFVYKHIQKLEYEKEMAQQALAQKESELKHTEAELGQTEAEKKRIEEEEKRLSVDSDRDGLTLREEQKLGTSDKNPDTDKDGIKDGEDTNPAGGGRYIVKYYEFEVFGEKHNIELRIHSDWYDYYKNKPRTPGIPDYITLEDPALIDLTNQLHQIVDEANSECHNCIVLSFVHSLNYVQDADMGYDEYKKYPIETLVDETGDCEDTAYLLGTILRMMDIDTVIIYFPGEHTAVGVYCPTCEGYYFTFNDKSISDRKYHYLESTGSNWQIGEMPDDYKGKDVILYRT